MDYGVHTFKTSRKFENNLGYANNIFIFAYKEREYMKFKRQLNVIFFVLLPITRSKILSELKRKTMGPRKKCKRFVRNYANNFFPFFYS